jgi:hypothetical protein
VSAISFHYSGFSIVESSKENTEQYFEASTIDQKLPWFVKMSYSWEYVLAKAPFRLCINILYRLDIEFSCRIFRSFEIFLTAIYYFAAHSPDLSSMLKVRNTSLEVLWVAFNIVVVRTAVHTAG